jgi:energy-coupling factor transporter transmembrane protein EcfT
VKNKLRLILLIIGIVITGVSALLIVVDGVAIIFTYASLVFVIASIGLKSKKVLVVYWLVFVVSNLTFGWRAYTDNNLHGSNTQASLSNNKLFVSCSNKMFGGVSSQQTELTVEQKKLFKICMSP